MFLKVFKESNQTFSHLIHYKHSSRTPTEPIPGGQACSHHHTGGAGEEQGGGLGEVAAGQVAIYCEFKILDTFLFPTMCWLKENLFLSAGKLITALYKCTEPVQ